MDDQHEMHLATTHPSGAEEWACPMCGRRFLMQWPPAYKKVVLEAGDEYAIHSCGKGGMAIERASFPEFRAGVSNLDSLDTTTYHDADNSLDTSDSKSADELRPWLKWMADANLDTFLDDAA